MRDFTQRRDVKPGLMGQTGRTKRKEPASRIT
jgi:hypothetical protein